MPASQRKAIPAQIEVVRRQIAAWRTSQRPGRRIPAALWDAAADVARIHGVSLTSTALGLAYTKLKQRVLAAGGAAPAPAPQFVELLPNMLAGDGGLCRVEITGRPGTVIRIEFPIASGAQMVGTICQHVLGQPR